MTAPGTPIDRSSGAALNIRGLRWGLRTKFLIAVTALLSIYAIASGSFVLDRLLGVTSRYILFSLHQGAESACARLALKPYTAGETQRLLRENDSASGFLFSGSPSVGSLIAENRLNAAFKVESSELWKVIETRSGGGKLANFTAEEVFPNGKYFLSGCRVDLSQGSQWLLFAADAGEAMRPAINLLIQIGFLFVALLVVALVVFFGLARSLTKPLTQLSELADDLGAGNYTRSISVSGTDELGVLADSFVILSQRLNDRESALEKTTELANQDFLTGLWNRRYLDRRAQEHFSLSKRHSHDMSVIYFDADHFKKINDTYGHAAGDEVLKSFASILSTQLRRTDFVARVGGEEFVMVLPETGLDGALQAAVKLRNLIKAHPFLGDKQIKVTASFGVASIGENTHLKNASELIALADKFAYESKTSGRDRITSSRGQIV